MANPPADVSTEQDTGDDELFDVETAKHYVSFVLGSVRRHKMLSTLVLALMVVMTVLTAKLLPRTYHTETHILAQRNQVMAALGNPGRSGWLGDSDAPTRAASETVLRRDNLIALVKQTNLIDQWEATRAPVLRAKDAAFRLVFGPLSEEDKLDAMVGTLERRLWVNTGDGTVTIGIDWPNAQMAYQLVEAAQQNFLEARHVSEVSAISEAISILEVHAAGEQKNIETAIQDLQKIVDAKKRGTSSGGASSPRPSPVPRPLVSSTETSDKDLAQLKFIIRAKRRAISDLEEFRNRRLHELQSQLTEQRVIYSVQHPVIVDLEHRISGLQQDSPQILALKRDEEQLIAEYTQRGGKDVDSLVEPRNTPRSSGSPTESVLNRILPETLEDPEVAVATDHLRMVTANYQDLLRRIDSARIELDTARAAFKYRYSVINPASIPKKPIKPNVGLIMIGGLMGSVLAAIFATVAFDLWRGRIQERWQVEQYLELPVLADIGVPQR